MEPSISYFCQSLSSFCNHVQSSSRALSDSIQRRPIPLDSAASSYLQSVERRVASTTADLELLDSMCQGTVSFEELLGHCREVYNTNTKYISQLQDRLSGFGYVPEAELEVEDDDEVSGSMETGLVGSVSNGSSLDVKSGAKSLDEDHLFEESISFQNLGLSDAALATLASEDNDHLASPVLPLRTVMSLDDGYSHEGMISSSNAEDISAKLPKVFSSTAEGIIKNVLNISRDDYDNLPSYMKSLASWEDLQDAVEKMNSYLCNKDKAKGNCTFSKDDLEKLELGRKGRSYLLLLLRMNQLVVEKVDGSIFYRVRPNTS